MFKKNIKPILMAGALALATAVSPVLAKTDDGYNTNIDGTKTYMDGSSINLIKTFNIADGADSFNSETFYFKCTPTGDNSANAPTVEWKLGNTTLTPDNAGKVGITFAKSEATPNPTDTQTLQLTFVPQQNEPTGVYTYQIVEVSGTNEKIDYDDSSYTVTVRVANANEDGTGQLVVDQIKIEKDNDKVGASTFVNNYNDSSNLIIKKVVTGKGANSNDDFKFTVSLTLPANYSGTKDFEIANNGTEHLSNTTEENSKKYIKFGNNTTFSFTADFDNNDQILIKGLPVGTTYTVSEEDNGYEASYVVTKGQTKVANSDNDNTKNSYENGLVYDSENTVVFTNEKDGENISTGVIINNMPYIALLGASGAGLVVLAASKKRSKK